MDHTKAVRKTVVTGINVAHSKSDHPMHFLIASEDKSKEAWAVFLRTRSGLLPETTSLYHFYSQADVDAFLSKNPVGSEIDNNAGWLDLEQKRLDFVRGTIDRRSAPGAGNAGDEESPLAFDVLDDAGLTSFVDGVSDIVLDSLGRQRIQQVKGLFGENWKVAAVFEYCWLHLPQSSPAYIAALYQFHYYITGDDFAAGYLWRDLETLVHGVEAAAINSLEMRKKAGLAGSEKSAQAREARRSALMDEMECLTQRNPDFAKLRPEQVAELALDSCVEKAPALWRQGRGQVAEYLGELRRGEAGPELKARFEQVFGAKPLRRFR
jgi:hypothetical protein